MTLEIDVTATSRETIAVLGPNGAGKTTLLRSLAGLHPLDSGSVELGGQILDEPATRTFVPAEDRPISVVFQDYLLFPHLTALDNIAFGLRSRGVRKSEANARAGAWLARVGLAGSEKARPRHLSGGQAQRVALARALVTTPRLLLLDEPLAALDATTRVATRRHLRAHLDSYEGITIVVTHDPLEAAALADRLVVLEHGRIVQQGTPSEISARPRSPYVADLVGVNLLRGRAAGNEVRLPSGLVIAVATSAAGSGSSVDEDVQVVIHPRAVALHRHRPEGTPRNVWPGEVVAVDREGDRARVSVQLDGASDLAVVLVAEVTAESVAEMALGRAERVWASVKATEVSLYPV